jgi:hypothetical protein
LGITLTALAIPAPLCWASRLNFQLADLNTILHARVGCEQKNHLASAAIGLIGPKTEALRVLVTDGIVVGMTPAADVTKKEIGEPAR